MVRGVVEFFFKYWNSDFFRFSIFAGQSMMIMVRWLKLPIGPLFVVTEPFSINKLWFAIILKIPYLVIKQKLFTTSWNSAKLIQITEKFLIFSLLFSLLLLGIYLLLWSEKSKAHTKKSLSLHIWHFWVVFGRYLVYPIW